MKRYVFLLAIVALTWCQSVRADGYVPYGRVLMSRMPNALFTSAGAPQPANGEAVAAPAVDGRTAPANDGYPFVDRCGSGCNSCCDGVWSGYSRSCFRGKWFGSMYGECGNCGCGGGCDNVGKHARLGYGSCGCDPCGCGAGGWGRGGCFGNSFAGGCGGCGGYGRLGLGGFGYAGSRLVLHRGFGFGCGCDSGCSDFGGCAGCAGNGYASGNGYSAGQPTVNAIPTQSAPTPATEEAPPVAPATKSALRPSMPRSYYPHSTNW